MLFYVLLCEIYIYIKLLSLRCSEFSSKSHPVLIYALLFFTNFIKNSVGVCIVLGFESQILTVKCEKNIQLRSFYPQSHKIILFMSCLVVVASIM